MQTSIEEYEDGDLKRSFAQMVLFLKSVMSLMRWSTSSNGWVWIEGDEAEDGYFGLSKKILEESCCRSFTQLRS